MKLKLDDQDTALAEVNRLHDVLRRIGGIFPPPPPEAKL